MPIKEIQHGKIRWINIDEINTETISYLKETFRFHHLDIEDIQSESQTPKMDVYRTYVFLILQFPHWDAEQQTVGLFEVDFFIGADFVITIQHPKSRDLKRVFYRCLTNKHLKKEWMSKDSGYLLYRIIESLYYHARPILNNLGKRISQIESDVFSDQPNGNTIRSLALHRRNILSFRRIIDPQRYLIGNLGHTKKSFFGEETGLYFDDVNDFLNKLWVIVDTYKDTLHGLQVTVESLINQRTNKVIGVLTIISVSLLPLTLLSGIYGMNISLPFADRPAVVGGMFIGLSVIIIALILLFRKRRML